MEPFVTSGGRNPVNDALRRMDWRSRSIVVGMIEDANSALETNATAISKTCSCMRSRAQTMNQQATTCSACTACVRTATSHPRSFAPWC